MEETRPVDDEPKKVPESESVKEVSVPAQEGLRQRKAPSTVSASPDKSKSVAISSGKRTERYIVAISDKIPEKARPYVVKAAPVVGIAVDFGESMIPHLIVAYEK